MDIFTLPANQINNQVLGLGGGCTHDAGLLAQTHTEHDLIPCVLEVLPCGKLIAIVDDDVIGNELVLALNCQVVSQRVGQAFDALYRQRPQFDKSLWWTCCCRLCNSTSGIA